MTIFAVMKTDKYDFTFEDFSENDLSECFDFSFDENNDIETRYIKPPLFKTKTELYKNAQIAAKNIIITENCNYFAFIAGNFIFGDLLEAIMTKQQLGAVRLDISTLGMSQDNVDSLANLLIKGYVKELNLIISDYFFVHERNRLIPYIYKTLDVDNKFQLIVTGNHCKIIAAKFSNGLNMVIHGSANLRSSGNIEQIAIQESKEICNFVFEINDKQINKYKTINKSIRGTKLWQVVATKAVNQGN